MPRPLLFSEVASIERAEKGCIKPGKMVGVSLPKLFSLLFVILPFLPSSFKGRRESVFPISLEKNTRFATFDAPPSEFGEALCPELRNLFLALFCGLEGFLSISFWLLMMAFNSAAAAARDVGKEEEDARLCKEAAKKKK